MKKLLTSILLFTLLVCLAMNVCAQGDVPAILSGEQDYVLLATVMDVNDSSVTLAPYHSIYNGKNGGQIPVNNNITVDKFRYSYCNDHLDISATPRVGDNIFVSLDKKGNGYTVANGAYKTNSVDYKLLTFYASESMKDRDCLAEIVALAYFVRTDGNMREFNFDNGTLTVENDSKILTLYPTEQISDTVTFVNINGKVIDNVKTKDVITNEPIKENRKNDFRWVVSILVILLSSSLGMLVVYNLNNKDNKPKKAKGE